MEDLRLGFDWESLVVAYGRRLHVEARLCYY